MVAFVGVVNHPFFAVTDKDGRFVLQNVPEGIYDVRAWHERFGTVTSHVRIESARVADAELIYASQPVSSAR